MLHICCDLAGGFRTVDLTRVLRFGSARSERHGPAGLVQEVPGIRKGRRSFTVTVIRQSYLQVVAFVVLIKFAYQMRC